MLSILKIELIIMHDNFDVKLLKRIILNHFCLNIIIKISLLNLKWHF